MPKTGKRSKRKYKRITISISSELVDKIDKQLQKGKWRSRTHLIEHVVATYFEKTLETKTTELFEALWELNKTNPNIFGANSKTELLDRILRKWLFWEKPPEEVIIQLVNCLRSKYGEDITVDDVKDFHLLTLKVECNKQKF